MLFKEKSTRAIAATATTATTPTPNIQSAVHCDAGLLSFATTYYRCIVFPWWDLASTATPYSTTEIICTDDLLCGLIVLRWLCISSCSGVVTIITLAATDLHRLPFNRASPSVAVIMKKASSVMPSLWCVIIDNDVPVVVTLY